MGKIDEFVIAYEMYEDGIQHMGTTEVQLPDLEFMTQELSGAGIGGKIDEIVTGNMMQMSATFNFRTIGRWTSKLLEPRVHNIDLRVAQQYMDTDNAVTDINNVKHVMRVKPKKISLGKLTAASTADASGEYSVLYYAMYVDGEMMTEIDPLNCKCTINGVDYFAKVRKALGKQ